MLDLSFDSPHLNEGTRMQRMKDAILRLLSSMKFWTMILGVITALGAKYGLKVDPGVYWSIVGLFGLLIGAQGLTDHGKTAAEITAASTTAAITSKDETK